MFRSGNIAGSTTKEWLIAFGIIISAFVVLYLLKVIVLKRLDRIARRTKSAWDDFALWSVERSLLPVLFSIVVYATLRTLTLPEQVRQAVYFVYLASITF